MLHIDAAEMTCYAAYYYCRQMIRHMPGRLRHAAILLPMPLDTLYAILVAIFAIRAERMLLRCCHF